MIDAGRFCVKISHMTDMKAGWRSENAAKATAARVLGKLRRWAGEMITDHGWSVAELSPTGFLKPDRPTSPVHYRDVCRECRDGLSAPSREVVCTPHERRALGAWSSQAFQYTYRCPAGHVWTYCFRTQSGYFSDCECDYCVTFRLEEGADHHARVAPYNWR